METFSDKKIPLTKVILVGESGVGKTCMMNMFSNGQMKSTHIPTIGIDFVNKNLDLENTKAKLQIWDTSGLQKYKALTTAYYKGTLGAIIVYAINDRNSFDALESFAKEVSSNGVPTVFLVGNKADDASNRVVETSEGGKFADNHNMRFFEINTQDYDSVKNVFLELSKEILMKSQSPSDNLLAKTEGETMQNKKTPVTRVVLVGKSRVGKSSVLSMFCKGEMNSNHTATIGVNFMNKSLDLENQKIQLQIWDTAGQEKFKAISTVYYKGAQGVVLIYAVNDRSSFDALEELVQEISSHGVSLVFLIGNKIDKTLNRVVETSEGQKFADDHNIRFFEISAQDLQSVENVFFELIKEIFGCQALESQMERED